LALGVVVKRHVCRLDYGEQWDDEPLGDATASEHHAPRPSPSAGHRSAGAGKRESESLCNAHARLQECRSDRSYPCCRKSSMVRAGLTPPLLTIASGHEAGVRRDARTRHTGSGPRAARLIGRQFVCGRPRTSDRWAAALGSDQPWP
jgi:hypothetical protein